MAGLNDSEPDVRLTVRLLSLPTRAQLAAAHDDRPDEHRELVVVALHPADDPSHVLGWGECSALNAPTYTDEWARGAFELLTGGGPIVAATAPMAAAAIEMAEIDAQLRSEGCSLSARLGTEGLSARAGAVVGLGPIPSMLDQIEAIASTGCQRIKCKIAPGRVVEPVRAVIDRFPELEVQVDANGSLGPDDLGLLAALRDLGVRAVEQPFPADDHATAARLVGETDLAVVADEGVDGPAELWALARDQAATAVAVKPPRNGGLRRALELVDAAVAAGLQCSVGGMLESGLGRHQLAALAPLEPFGITGDVSPARRWLAVDPFPDIEMIDGQIPAPSSAGVAGPPDDDVLAACTVAVTTVPKPVVITAGPSPDGPLG